MRRKNATWLALLTLILTLSTIGAVSSPLVPTISVSPPSIIGPPPTIDETFTVNITVSDVVDLYTWQAGMTFNANVLEALSFVEGPFLKKGGTTLWVNGTIDNVGGSITYHACTLTGNITGVSGNGTLGSITFRVKDYGNSTLHLTDIILLDSTLTEITPVNKVDGYFELLPVLKHDVAITSVTVSILCGLHPIFPSWSVNVTVVAKNNGNYTESFNVTAYHNLTAIETKTVTDLAPGNETTLIFTWKTELGYTSPGNYTISAEASAVPGETLADQADNTKVDGTVEVWKPGDADGSGFVDIGDFGILGASWFKGHGEPGYLWQADFDGSGFVDIGDFGILGAYWFKDP